MEINLDTDGYINESYYLNACMDIIDRGLIDRGIDPNKVSSNYFLYLLRQCYKSLFKPNKTLLNNQQCIIPYNTTNIQRLINIYSLLVEKYQTLPSVYAFECLTGMEEESIDRHVTNGRNTIRKLRKSAVQNKLYDTTIGVIALANNDIDTGLLYTRQNIVDHATVKKALSFADLRQIADGNGGAMAHNDISGHLEQGEKVEEMP